MSAAGRIWRDRYQHILANIQNQRLEGASTISLGSADASPPLDTPLPSSQETCAATLFARARARQAHTYVQAQMQAEWRQNAASTISLGAADMVPPLDVAGAPGGTTWRQDTIASTNLRQHRQAFQQYKPLADPNAPIDISDSDTGTGTDAGEFVDLTEGDTGTGTDAGETLDVLVTPTRGPDVASFFQRNVRKTHTYIQAQLQVRAINGADVTTILTEFYVTDSDTGTGTDASELVDLTEADTGTGTDAGEVLDVFINYIPPITVASVYQRTVRKTHTYVQAQIQVRAINNAAGITHILAQEAKSDSDSGIGTDAGELVDLTEAEVGAGTDAGEAITATSSEADTGTGTDAGELVDLTESDAGTGTDAGESVEVFVSPPRAPDVASFFQRNTRKTHTYVQAQIQVRRINNGASVTTVLTQFADTDTGTGTDAGEAVDTTESEAGTGTDAGELLGITSSDTGVGTDAGELVAVGEADAGTGSDIEVVGPTEVDTGVGSDAEALTLAEADTATGTDLESLTATVIESDSGSSTDAESLQASISATDQGTGIDDQALAASVTGADTGVGIDGGEDVNVGINKFDGDVGTVIDAGEAIEAPVGGNTLHIRWAVDFTSVGELLTPMLAHGLAFHGPEAFPLGFAPLTLIVSIQSTGRVVPPATLPITVTANQPIARAKCFFVDAFQNETQVGYNTVGQSKLVVSLLTTGLPGGQSTFRVEVADLTGNVTVASLPVLIARPKPFDAVLVIGPKTLSHHEDSHALEVAPSATSIFVKPYDAILVISKHGLASQEGSHPMEMV